MLFLYIEQLYRLELNFWYDKKYTKNTRIYNLVQNNTRKKIGSVRVPIDLFYNFCKVRQEIKNS